MKSWITLPLRAAEKCFPYFASYWYDFLTRPLPTGKIRRDLILVLSEPVVWRVSLGNFVSSEQMWPFLFLLLLAFFPSLEPHGCWVYGGRGVAWLTWGQWEEGRDSCIHRASSGVSWPLVQWVRTGMCDWCHQQGTNKVVLMVWYDGVHATDTGSHFLNQISKFHLICRDSYLLLGHLGSQHHWDPMKASEALHATPGGHTKPTPPAELGHPIQQWCEGLWELSASAQGALTKFLRLNGLTDRNWFLHSSGVWESKIKVLVGLVLVRPLSLTCR